mgnify:CR=1 FL=1
MSYTAAIIWYLAWLAVIVGSYFLAHYAVKAFDKKWKTVSEEEEKELENNKE